MRLHVRQIMSRLCQVVPCGGGGVPLVFSKVCFVSPVDDRQRFAGARWISQRINGILNHGPRILASMLEARTGLIVSSSREDRGRAGGLIDECRLFLSPGAVRDRLLGLDLDFVAMGFQKRASAVCGLWGQARDGRGKTLYDCTWMGLGDLCPSANSLTAPIDWHRSWGHLRKYGCTYSAQACFGERCAAHRK